MAAIQDLVATICPEIESELKPRLRGIMGGFVRGYLPQTWHFITEGGSATLAVDRDGNATALSGQVGEPDVVIRTTAKILQAAFTERDRGRVPAGPFEATPVTGKGKTAFDMLRKRFGL